MAIKLPQLQKIQSAPDASVGRVNVKAQDNSSLILNQTKAVTNVINQVDETYYRIEDKKINSASQESNIEGKGWNDNKLNELSKIEGDPTEAYAKYDQEAYEKKQEILKKYENASDRVKAHVAANLDKTFSGLSAQTNRQRGAQQETYENNMYETGVALSVDNIASNLAGTIRPNNPDSFIEMENGLGDLTSVIAKRAIEKGNAEVVKEGEAYTHSYKDPEGNIVRVKMDNLAKSRVAKERSKAVSMSIDSLIGAGQTQSAKDTFARYKNYMTASEQTKINKKLHREDVSATAYSKMAEMRGLDSDQQMQKINSVKDEEVRSKLLAIKDKNDGAVARIRKREVQASYNLISNVAAQGMESGYYSMADLEESDEYKSNWEKLDAKTRQAIKEQIKAPKKSSSASLHKVQDLFFDRKKLDAASDMSLEDFRVNYLNGLEESDKKKYYKEFEEMKNPSNSQRRASFNLAGDRLKQHLMSAKVISSSGKKNASERQAEIDAMSAYQSYVDSLGRLPTPDETEKVSAKIAASAVIKEGGWFEDDKLTFTYKPEKKLNTVKASKKTVEGNIVISDRTERQRLKKEYRKAKNLDASAVVSNNNAEYQAWLKEENTEG